MTKLQKGFTLIELLVVIAIIGILAGILFVSINPSSKINEANDASVKSSLSGIPAVAMISYTTFDGADTDTEVDYSYDNVCNETSIASMVTGLSSANADCDDSITAYAVQADLEDSKFFCVDSTGFKGVTTTTKGATVTVCP